MFFSILLRGALFTKDSQNYTITTNPVELQVNISLRISSPRLLFLFVGGPNKVGRTVRVHHHYPNNQTHVYVVQMLMQKASSLLTGCFFFGSRSTYFVLNKEAVGHLQDRPNPNRIIEPGLPLPNVTKGFIYNPTYYV